MGGRFNLLHFELFANTEFTFRSNRSEMFADHGSLVTSGQQRHPIG
jgi:hypothetical protein